MNLKRCLSTTLLALGLVRALQAGASPERYLVPEDATLVLAHDAGTRVWDQSRITDLENPNIEFPNLARFGGHWYCSFREGLAHGNHLSGRGRVLRSSDGGEWETVALFESDTGDVRDPRLSVTPDGRLMLNASIYYLPEAAPLEVLDGVEVQRRSVTWLSHDGLDWSGPHFCPTGINTWRWDVAWHDGYGYSIGYSGKDRDGTLYRTADGKQWEVWLESVFPRGGGYNEAALAFGVDGTAYCLLRGHGSRSGQDATIGSAPPPYNGEWTWRAADVMEPGSAHRRPFPATSARNLGGPKLIALPDGRLIGAARAGGGQGGVKLYRVDPLEATLTVRVDVRGGSSYPGLVDHDGDLWFSYIRQGNKGPVYLARVRLPERTGLPELLEMADAQLAEPMTGFGRRYQLALDAAREQAVDPARQDPTHETLRRALSALQSLREHRRQAEILRETARATLAQPVRGFGVWDHAHAQAAADPLDALLGDDQATAESLHTVTAALELALNDVRLAARLRNSALATLDVADSIAAQQRVGFGRLLRAVVTREAATLRERLESPESRLEGVQPAFLALRLALSDDQEATPASETTVREMAVADRLTIGDPAHPDACLKVGLTMTPEGLIPDQGPVPVFSGRNSLVNFGNPPRIADIRRDLTLSVWAYPETTESAYRTILVKGAGPRGVNGFYLRHGRTGLQRNTVSVNVFGMGEPHDSYSLSYRPADPEGFDHRWHHYALTYDGSRFRFFIDGEQVVERAFAGQVDLSDPDLTASRRQHEPWYGYLQDVRIFDLALTPEQVRAEAFHLPVAGTPELLGYWPLNEGGGDIAADASGGGHPGVVEGVEWRKLPVRRGWRISGPYRFNGSSAAAGTRIQWSLDNEQQDVNAVQIRVGGSDRPDALPLVWHDVKNGGTLPALNLNPDTGALHLWIRTDLITRDPDNPPLLRDLTLERQPL